VLLDNSRLQVFDENIRGFLLADVLADLLPFEPDHGRGVAGVGCPAPLKFILCMWGMSVT
jgi:hypothetical protein